MNFYQSKEWKDLRKSIILQRGNICAKCNTVVLDSSKLIGHHIEPITDLNLDDTAVTLNPNNIEIICLDCHNKEHNRFGSSLDKQVYIIWGSPCSGKTTYVLENMKFNDIIIDIDYIWSCFSGQPLHIKPQSAKELMYNVHRFVLEQVKLRVGNWKSAYIVSSQRKTDIDRIAKELGAKVVFIDTDKQTCLNRAEICRSKIWRKFINEWFDINTPLLSLEKTEKI